MFFNWRNNKTQTQSNRTNGTNGSVPHVTASKRKPAIDLAIPTKTETATFALG